MKDDKVKKNKDEDDLITATFDGEEIGHVDVVDKRVDATS